MQKHESYELMVAWCRENASGRVWTSFVEGSRVVVGTYEPTSDKGVSDNA